MSHDYGFACPGFNPPSFNMDDRLGSDPGAARLARSARIVRRARVLLSGVMVGSFIAQWCITTNQVGRWVLAANGIDASHEDLAAFAPPRTTT